MTWARHRGFLLAAFVALAMASCTTPTLPLPPPETPFVSAGSAPDTFKLSSLNGAAPNALVLVVNRNEDLPANQRVTGTIADATGSWNVVVIARSGDVLDISQEAGSTRSPGITITVK